MTKKILLHSLFISVVILIARIILLFSDVKEMSWVAPMSLMIFPLGLYLFTKSNREDYSLEESYSISFKDIFVPILKVSFFVSVVVAVGSFIVYSLYPEIIEYKMQAVENDLYKNSNMTDEEIDLIMKTSRIASSPAVSSMLDVFGYLFSGSIVGGIFGLLYKSKDRR
ncbi:MAG: DUF4199 family protein [Flavobacteriales bacterium]